MKDLIILICTVLGFSGCTKTLPETNGENEATKEPVSEESFKGEIVEKYDDSYLLCTLPEEENLTGLYYINNISKVSGSEDVEVGDIVEVYFDGGIMETYPAQIGSASYLKYISEGNDLINLYEEAIDDLYSVDTGLNPKDGGILAFNFEKATNLTDEQKEALTFIISNKYGMESLNANFDELLEMGYINKETNHFENGMLIEISVTEENENGFIFSASKWVSGLGAYFFMDCKATKTNDGYLYERGMEAIS